MNVNSSSLGQAAEWFDAVLAGLLVIAICTIALAALGLALFAGRLDIRRGAAVIIGCFLVLGASNIANGLIGSSTGLAAVPEFPLAPRAPLQIPPRKDRNVDDPYAGASLAH